MKKIYMLIVVIFLLLTNISNVFANSNDSISNFNGISMTTEEYANFLNLGFTYEEIMNMPYETYLVYQNVDYTKVDKQSNKYFRETIIEILDEKRVIIEEISKYDYDHEIFNDDIIIPYSSTSYETTYKKLTLTSLEISNLYPNVRTVTSTLTWKRMPSVRSYDIYAARVTNGEIAANTYSGSMTSIETRFDENCGNSGTKEFTVAYTSTNTTWNKQNASIGYSGIGYTGKLENASDVCWNDLGMFFSTASGYYSTLTFQSVVGATVYVSYQHATTSISHNSVFLSYSYSNFGLGNVIYFNNSVIRGYYDGMSGVSLTL